jgi:catechol 2,3-dioxygenase-like lactoylglutathione lyase family enzyme
MKRLHVNVKVRELEESVRFYSTLFGAEPTLTKADYAKWMLDDPRVNFAIVQAPGNGNGHGIEHLGIQAETEAELAELRQRIGAIEGEVFDEGETVCCYHASDKTWVTDAQGVSWETFYTSGEADVMKAPAAAEGECCAANCCA